ncbi:MAG: hypothetical protein NTV49_07345 [Kiritimatiellaeota bacterium]|nr:hypothetical protein [Kiritimatiellota bacterium]
MNRMTIKFSAMMAIGVGGFCLAAAGEEIRGAGSEDGYPSLDKLVKSPGRMTYYVDPANGDDGNSGVRTENPWRSLRMVNRLLLAAGDRIELKPGSFNETLKPSGAGSIKQPIVIRFAPGEYDFYPEQALKLKLHISNTDDDPNTPKAIALAFRGIRHVQVLGGAEGKKSDLYMRGKMIQTFFDHAEDIRLDGLAFDYRRPTTSEYTVAEVAADHAVLAIHKDSKYAMENGPGRVPAGGAAAGKCCGRHLVARRDQVRRCDESRGARGRQDSRLVLEKPGVRQGPRLAGARPVPRLHRVVRAQQ